MSRSRYDEPYAAEWSAERGWPPREEELPHTSGDREQRSRHERDERAGYGHPGERSYDRSHEERRDGPYGYRGREARSWEDRRWEDRRWEDEWPERGHGQGSIPTTAEYRLPAYGTVPYGYGRGDEGRLGGRAPYENPMQGPYRGRGPRGYERSAERIREEVCERLTDHPAVDASDIQVEVRGGVVVLSGSVDDRAQKRAAEDAAAEVSGIRDVRNEIEARKGMWETLKEAVTGQAPDDEEEPVRRSARRAGSRAV